MGQGFRKPHILTTFCSKSATSACHTFTKLYSPVENLEAFLHVEFHLSSSSGTYLSANPRWLFWGRGSENRTFSALFAPKNAISTWCIFTKLYSPVDMGKALLHVERHCSSTSGTYPGANPRCISANPSLCSNSETAWPIFFKFTVQSCSVANLMHVKRQLFICIISDTFPSRFCPKSANFRGVGYSNCLISVTVQCISMPFQI